MEAKFNAITGKFDLIGMTSTELGAFLKLDQTIEQDVDNGVPQFNKGIALKSGEKLYFDSRA